MANNRLLHSSGEQPPNQLVCDFPEPHGDSDQTSSCIHRHCRRRRTTQLRHSSISSLSLVCFFFLFFLALWIGIFPVISPSRVKILLDFGTDVADLLLPCTDLLFRGGILQRSLSASASEALDTFNTAIVSPIYYVMFTTLTIVDWPDQNFNSIMSEICGFITVLSGTLLLHATREQDTSDAFPAAGLSSWFKFHVLSKYAEPNL